MELGLRVVRGPNWILEDSKSDGGEGFVGTVVEVGGNSSSLPENLVWVQWDSGIRHDHRAGYYGAYDLYVLDSAPAGVSHYGIKCNACWQKPLLGMRWHCAACKQPYDLCTSCYMKDEHKKSHNFLRIDDVDCKGVNVGVRHSTPRVQSRGIFPGSKAMRGPCWEWGDEDGGKGKEGVVKKITSWRGTPSSAAVVSWDYADEGTYRLGYQGKVDLRCTVPGVGGFYYKSHLPKLGEQLLKRGPTDHRFNGSLEERANDELTDSDDSESSGAENKCSERDLPNDQLTDDEVNDRFTKPGKQTDWNGRNNQPPEEEDGQAAKSTRRFPEGRTNDELTSEEENLSDDDCANGNLSKDQRRSKRRNVHHVTETSPKFNDQLTSEDDNVSDEEDLNDHVSEANDEPEREDGQSISEAKPNDELTSEEENASGEEDLNDQLSEAEEDRSKRGSRLHFTGVKANDELTSEEEDASNEDDLNDNLPQAGNRSTRGGRQHFTEAKANDELTSEEEDAPDEEDLNDQLSEAEEDRSKRGSRQHFTGAKANDELTNQEEDALDEEDLNDHVSEANDEPEIEDGQSISEAKPNDELTSEEENASGEEDLINDQLSEAEEDRSKRGSRPLFTGVKANDELTSEEEDASNEDDLNDNLPQAGNRSTRGGRQHFTEAKANDELTSEEEDAPDEEDLNEQLPQAKKERENVRNFSEAKPNDEMTSDEENLEGSGCPNDKLSDAEDDNETRNVHHFTKVKPNDALTSEEEDFQDYECPNGELSDAEDDNETRNVHHFTEAKPNDALTSEEEDLQGSDCPYDELTEPEDGSDGRNGQGFSDTKPNDEVTSEEENALAEEVLGKRLSEVGYDCDNENVQHSPDTPSNDELSSGQRVHRGADRATSGITPSSYLTQDLNSREGLWTPQTDATISTGARPKFPQKSTDGGQSLPLSNGKVSTRSNGRASTNQAVNTSSGNQQNAADVKSNTNSGHTNLKASRSLLHKAAIKGQWKTVKMLIQNGENVDQRDQFDLTPLHLAAWYGKEDTVKLLLEHNADPDALDKPSLGSLCKMALVRTDRGSGLNLIQAAAYEGIYDITLKCVVSLDDPIREINVESTMNNAKVAPGKTAYDILSGKHTAEHRKLRSLFEETFEKTASLSELHECAVSGDVEKAVELVVENEIDVNVRAMGGRTPLLWGCPTASSEFIECLVALGAELDALREDNVSSLELASEWNNYMTIKVLAQNGTNLDRQNLNGETPLHSAVKRGSYNLAKLLIDSGCNVNVQNSNGETPLHLASEKGDNEITKLLLEGGADPNVHKLLTLLDGLVVVRGEDQGRDTWHYLLVNKPCLGLFSKTLESGVCELEAFGSILESGSGEDGPSPSKKKEICEELGVVLQGTCDVTPFHLACQGGDLQTIDLFVQHGAKIDAVDADGYTALHMAVVRGQSDVVQKLVALNADINAETVDRRSALALAVMNSEPEIAQFLRSLYWPT